MDRKEINLISLTRTTQAEMKEMKEKIEKMDRQTDRQTGKKQTNYNFILNRIRQTDKAKNSSNCDHHQA